MTTTAAGKNVTERSPSSNGPLVTPSGSKQSNHQHSAELCDKLNLTPRQKQMCVRGGEGMAETLLEGTTHLHSIIKLFKLPFKIKT